MTTPLYPDLRVAVRSLHPLAWVSATRHVLRRAGLAHAEIDRFTEEAVAAADPAAVRGVCGRWVRVEA